MGWISYLTLVSFTAGTTTQGLAVLNHPTYVPQAWHSTLLCWAVVGFGFLFNTVLAPRLPAVEIFFFILHVVGWFGIFVTLLVLGPRHNPHDTFLVLHDTAGWNSVGLATVITMANSVAMFVGYESPVHMCKWPLRSAGMFSAVANIPRPIVQPKRPKTPPASCLVLSSGASS